MSSTELLPTLPEEITASWLAKKLGRKIKTIEAARTDHGTASKLFYTVTLDGDEDEDKPLQICVKGGFNPVMRAALPLAVHWWINEAEFFRIVASSTILSAMEPPACLWCGRDERQGIVIMPDLAAHGCTFGDPERERSVAEVMTGVEQLAALHAATWGCSAADDYPWLVGQPNYMDFVVAELAEDKYHLTGGADMTRPIPDKMRDRARTEAVLQKYMRLRNPRFHALLHGDAHVGNTFYKPGQDGGLRFLDWQLYFVGPVFHDVSYFIGSSLTVEDRREHETAILDHYLKTLVRLGKERGVPDLKSSDEDVWTEYRKSFLSGFGWVVTYYVMQPPARVHAMIRRYVAAMEDHGSFELVESLPDVK
jgi:hypothetical protein